MNTSKKNSFAKLLSFLLLAVLLISIICFAVSGWQAEPQQNSGDSNGLTPDDTLNLESNGNGSNTDIPTSSDPIEEKYYNTVTGLEITKERYNTSPLAFLIDSRANYYGISRADVCIEIPTEKDSRLLFYTTDYSSLWKIGALTHTRDYINVTANFLGVPIFFYQNDSITNYGNNIAPLISLDLSLFKDSFYKESSLFYTNKNMISSVFRSESEDAPQYLYKSAPFVFTSEDVTGTIKAIDVIIPYSQDNVTHLVYSEEENAYLYKKNNTACLDRLTGDELYYKNVFILLAKSTTHESLEGAELVLDTAGGGKGYYMSNGKMIEFFWSVDETGELKFASLSQEPLEVTRGNSYIAYYKSFDYEKITIS